MARKLNSILLSGALDKYPKIFMDLESESAIWYVQQGSHCRQANNWPGIRATLQKWWLLGCWLWHRGVAS